MPAHEVNFDGLVGPSHNYAGLSSGNLASTAHGGARSNPREAALQGLAKMKFLADLGVPQAVLPPHPRPSLEALRALGFGGSDAQVLRAAARHAPRLLVACSSASAMWAANAATVAPSRDAADRRVHFTPANLVSKFHRSIEPAQTARTLRAIFRDPAYFQIHDALPATLAFADEGAANHTRFAPAPFRRGLHLFVYGHHAFATPSRSAGRLPVPQRFPSRQSLEASEAIARCHDLAPAAVVFAQQHPAAIDAGVFHNDVISVGHENVFLYHEHAFVDTPHVIAELRRRFAALHRGRELIAVRVPASRVSLADAVRSYLFNSQLVTLRSGHLALIAPRDCADTPAVHAFLDDLLAGARTPIREVHYLDLKQSMRNGGGPACLRLRVVLTDAERRAVAPGVFLTNATYAALVAWVRAHYPERLTVRDLADPALLENTHRALDRLTQLLALGSIYPFQR